MTPAPISVERLRELLDKATPGPWSQDHRRGKDGGYRTQVFDASGDEIATLAWHAKPPRYEDGRKIISTDRAENAELIVAAVNALPALLQQLAESEREASNRHWQVIESDAMCADLRDKLAEREAELSALRQACWDARAVLGFDNDGDPTPDALVYPSLADLVRRDAAEFRKDYDEACNEAHAAERAREAACGLLKAFKVRPFKDMGRDELTIQCPSGYIVTVSDRGRLENRVLHEIAAAFLAASGGA